MALLVLVGIASSTNQQNMYAMAASGSRRKKRTAKVAKKKLPKRRRKKQIRIKKHQRRIIKQYAKKRYRKHKPKIKRKPIRKHYKHKVKPRKQRTKGFNPAERRAKAWIAWHESRGRWYVSNGYCYGKYQLMPAYLHGDYSPANQSRAADHYVHSRYGTWQHAKYFWQIHHWY